MNDKNRRILYMGFILLCLFSAEQARAAESRGAAGASPAFPQLQEDLATMAEKEGAVPPPPRETWVQRKNASGETVYSRCTATQCDMPRKVELPEKKPKPAGVAGTAVEDILKGQPENSLLIPENSGDAEQGTNDWSGLYGAMDLLGEAMETAEEPEIKTAKGGAIDDALRMREQARRMQSSDSSADLHPDYRNSKTFESR